MFHNNQWKPVQLSLSESFDVNTLSRSLLCTFISFSKRFHYKFSHIITYSLKLNYPLDTTMKNPYLINSVTVKGRMKIVLLWV